MSTPFDFNEFKTQYDLKNSLSQLTTFLSTARNPNGQRILPAGPNDPLTNLIKTLNLSPAQDMPQFDFELQNVTIRTVEQLARDNNRPILDCIKSTCGRAYYNRNLDRPNNPEDWVEMSRPEASDHNTELSRLLYLDPLMQNSRLDTNNATAQKTRHRQSMHG
jgi:hypothetical protein